MREVARLGGLVAALPLFCDEAPRQSCQPFWLMFRPFQQVWWQLDHRLLIALGDLSWFLFRAR